MTIDAALAHEARILRLRLELGIVKLEQVIEWADTLITRMDTPPYELIEVSLVRVKGRDAALAALKAMGGNTEAAGDVVLALASAEPAELSYNELHALLAYASNVASHFQVQGDDGDADAVLVLWRAYDHDCFWPEPDEQAGRQTAIDEATKYLRLVREVAAGVASPTR